MSAPTLPDLPTTDVFLENDVNAVPALLAPSVTFDDPDNDFDGGHLDIGGLLAEDRISIRDQGIGAGEIGLSGTDVTYGGIVIGTMSGGIGTDFHVLFNAAATSEAIDALIENLTYADVSNAPTASRNLVLNVTDAAGNDLDTHATGFTLLADAANPFAGIDIGDQATPAFVDLDGDGKLDLVLGDLSGAIAAYHNNGDGTFTQLTGSNNPFDGIDVGHASRPVFVDLDGDGKLDLVSGEAQGGLFAFHNNGDGTFTALTGGSDPLPGVAVGAYSSPAFIDLDGDGHLDVLVGESNGQISSFHNNGDGSFTQLTGAADPFDGVVTGSYPSLATVDLDGDGKADLVVGNDNGTLSAFHNNGDGTFTALTGTANPFDGMVIDSGLSPVFVDLDGDGDFDAVVGDYDGHVHVLDNGPLPAGQVITVQVTAEPDAPSFTGLDASVTFAETLVNGAPQLIDADVDFQAPDNNLDGGTLVITGLLDEDALSVNDQGTGAGEIGYDSSGGIITYGGVPIAIICGCSGDTRTIQFNANATGEAVDALIQNLAYTNSSDAPTESRTLTFEFTDADGNVLDSDVTIHVTAENDAPVAAVTAAGSVGGEILVNTAIDGDQVYAQSSALAGGGFVVTWTDLGTGVGGADGDGAAVKAQVFAADGTPLGSEILVNTDTPGDQLAQSVTGLTGGGFVVTWEDDGGNGGDASPAGVHAQVFAADGTPVGSEFLVNTATADDQYNGIVTALSGGGFVVTWADTSEGVGGATGDSSSLAVKAQVYAADGTPVGTEILVNTATDAEQGDQQVTALSNGGFVVTWTDSSEGVGGATGDPSLAAVKAQVFAADGTPVGTEILVNTATDGPQIDQKIVALAGGGFAITWTDLSQGIGGATGDTDISAIKLQLFTDSGVPLGTEILVNTTTQSLQADAKIAALTGGGFVVTWADASGGSDLDIRAQVFDADGTPHGSEMLVNSVTAGDQLDATVLALADGGFLVTWEDDSDGAPPVNGEVKGQIFSADGTRLGGEFLVNTAIADPQGDARSIALADGSFVVVWNDLSQGQGGATGDTDGAAIKAQVYSTGFTATEQTLLDLKGHIAVTDGDAAVDNGDLTVTLSVDSGVLTVTAGTSGADVAGSGTDHVTITGTIAEITALLGSDPTSALGYLNGSDTPPATVTLQVDVDDGGNSGAGGPATGSTSYVIPIAAVDDLPVATTDVATTLENATTTIAVLANDDVDGGPPAVVAKVNGTTLTAGQSVTIASGAIVTLNADGTLGYDPNHKFDTLVAASSGAANGSAIDSFTYALDNGTSTTVNVTVNGITGPTDRLLGDTGGNTITGTSGTDRFDLSQGGDDHVSGGDGNDSFRFGAAFTVDDVVDGGANTDQIALQGDYTGGNALTIGGNLTNVEMIALLAGFDYNITTLDSLLAPGQSIAFNGSFLGAGDDFTFNGSAETNGSFTVYGGLGADHITTGGGNDTIQFNAGMFNPLTDHVDGGAGTDTLYINNGVTMTLDSATIANIETLSLGAITPTGTYNLTLADNWIGAGETRMIDARSATGAITINASAETSGKLTVIGGSGGNTLIGSSGDDVLKGGSGVDRITGGAGADTLNGRGGADVFVYGAASESMGVNHDTIVAFDPVHAKIDLPFAITGVDAAKTGGALSTASFDANLTTALSTLGAHHAVEFNPLTGDLAGHHFLILDANGVEGYQAGQDMVIELITPYSHVLDPTPFI